MRTGKFNINGENVWEKTADFIKKLYPENVCIESKKMMVFQTEQWSMLQNKVYMITVCILQQEDDVEVHITCGGLISGILNTDWGKTREVIHAFYEQINTYARYHSLQTGPITLKNHTFV